MSGAVRKSGAGTAGKSRATGRVRAAAPKRRKSADEVEFDRLMARMDVKLEQLERQSAETLRRLKLS